MLAVDLDLNANAGQPNTHELHRTRRPGRPPASATNAPRCWWRSAPVEPDAVTRTAAERRGTAVLPAPSCHPPSVHADNGTDCGVLVRMRGLQHQSPPLPC